MNSELRIRPITLEDCAALCDLLNDIIAAGGTTAHQRPFDLERFSDEFVHAESLLFCVVAETSDNELMGIQSVGKHPRLDAQWGDIATFTRVGSTTRGIGSALFATTKKLAIDKKLVAINATIRADNAGGLAYYSKMGFVDYAIAQAVPLEDGTPVDR
ncbi:MAG: GNAT family N-acetyltransferase, partial [Gammaproteobacteria bacterium]|nr:GNAT family N-acetyltransferase [Gammaproteobacteria bacterium]